MNILDLVKDLVNPLPELRQGYSALRKPRAAPRRQQGPSLHVGENFYPPPLERPNRFDVDVSPESRESNILQGIDQWNGAPFRPQRPARMRTVKPRTGGTVWGWWGEDFPKFGPKELPIDPGINAGPRPSRRLRLPLYIEEA